MALALALALAMDVAMNTHCLSSTEAKWGCAALCSNEAMR